MTDETFLVHSAQQAVQALKQKLDTEDKEMHRDEERLKEEERKWAHENRELEQRRAKREAEVAALRDSVLKRKAAREEMARELRAASDKLRELGRGDRTRWS